MKKILSLVLVLSLVLGTFSFAFAADTPDYTEAGNILKELGVLQGDGSDLMLDQELKRQDMIVLLSRLMGKEDVAKNFPFEPTFTDIEDPFYAPYIAWAQAEGLTNGIGNGLFGFNQKLTVAQLQTFLLRALGYDNAWENRAQLVEEAGLMAGLVADETATAVRGLMAAMTVNTLKATVKGEGKTLAAKLNLELPKEIVSLAAVEATVKVGEAANLPATITATYDDGSTAEVAVTWAAVDTSKVGTVTVEGTVEGTEIKAVATITVEEPELAVESVTATNLKEVVVKFNKAVDEEVAGDVANYTIEGKTVEAATVDGDTVVLTITEGFTQQEDFTLEIASDLVEAEVTATAFDTTPPVAQSIELTGPKTIKIIFSEPIKTVGTILIDNGVYGTEAPVVNGNEVTVDLVAELTEGDYTVEVSNFYDYADFKALTKEFTLNYVKDTTAPVASIKEATQTKVVVKFNKPVKLEDGTDLTVDYFYHTFKAWKPVSIDPNTDKTEYTLYFTDDNPATTDYPIAEGTTTLVVDYDANDKEIVDLWGNSMGANAELEITVTADKTAPKVTKVEAGDTQDIVEIYFDEEIKIDGAEFVVKDSEGEDVTPAPSAAVKQDDNDNYYVELDFADDLAGTYTIEIKDVTDAALEANTMPTTVVSVTIDDITTIDTNDVTAAAVDGDTVDYIYITYPEKMAVSGEYSVLDKEKYLIDGVKLGKDDKVEIFGSADRIRIVLADETAYDFANGDTLDLTIGRIADAAGNPITALAFTVSNVAEETPPAIEEVNVIDYNKIEIVVDKILTTVTASGFMTEYTVGTDVYSEQLASVSFKVEDGKTIITGTLRSNSQLDKNDTADKDVTLNVVANKIKADYGMYLPEGTYSGTVNDKRAPEFASIATSGNKITVTFTEALGTNYETLYATDLIVKDADGNVLVAGVDYSTTVNGADLIIDLGDSVTDATGYKVGTKDTITYIRDAFDNIAKSFDLQDVE